jgi:Protein of unknown function (DUF2934)
MAAKKERPAPAKAPKTRTTTKPRATRPEPSFGAHARAEVSAEEVRKLIAEAAYYRAKKRGFTPGHEVEDWVQAEAEVLRRIGADESPGRSTPPDGA